MPPESPLVLDVVLATRYPSVPANDTVPCRLDLVMQSTRPRRLSVDGIERLRFTEGAPHRQAEGPAYVENQAGQG